MMIKPWRACVMGLAVLLGNPVYAIQMLTDTELADTTGQSLLTTKYTAPTGSGTSNFGFYQLGVQGILNVNTNIANLQLGCGGVNGAGGCDENISQVAISGATGPNSDAILTNPFISFAFKNPKSASTRELVGFKFGAEAMSGLMQFGTQSGLSQSGGISSFSGYLVAKGNSGTAYTNPTTFTNNITGRLVGEACLGICLPISGTFNGYNANFPIASLPVTYNVPNVTIIGNRQTAIPTQYLTAPLPNINLNGGLTTTSNITACFIICIPMTLTNPVSMSGTVSNSNVNITLNENLSYIHQVDLSNNPLSISMQKTAVFWPGGSVAAQKGWWMDFGTNPVDVGNYNATTTIDINDMLPAIGNSISNYFNANPLNIGSVPALSTILGGPINVSGVGINLGGQYFNKSVSNLVLSSQDTIPNCYGRSFC